MSQEPMFNIPEKAPLWLCGILIAIQAIVSIAPPDLINLIYGLAILVPVQTPDVPIPRQAFSLLGHGFLHGGWSHALMNAAMIIIFGVITLRGIKAFLRHRTQAGSPNVLFLLIFVAGVVVGGLAQWLWWIVPGTGLESALGASGGASALFATTAWAMGGRYKMMQFGFGWLVLNAVMVATEPMTGIGIAWPAHLGGYLAGMFLASRCVKPNSSGFSITG